MTCSKPTVTAPATTRPTPAARPSSASRSCPSPRTGAIYLVETRNSGAAFALGTGATAVLTVIALAVVAIILRTARRMYSVGWAVALGLILGGALGNIVDRLFREPGVGRGHVVDWIS